MGISAAIGAVSVAASAIGTGISVSAAQAQGSAQKQALAAEQQAEATRQQAMNYEAERQKQETIRQAQVARGVALNNAANSGSQFGSGVQGGISEITGASDTRVGGIGTEQSFGNSIFAANAARTGAQIRGADAQAEGAIGSGISSLGGMLIRDQGTITNIFGNLSGKVNGI